MAVSTQTMSNPGQLATWPQFFAETRPNSHNLEHVLDHVDVEVGLVGVRGLLPPLPVQLAAGGVRGSIRVSGPLTSGWS